MESISNPIIVISILLGATVLLCIGTVISLTSFERKATQEISKLALQIEFQKTYTKFVTEINFRKKVELASELDWQFAHGILAAPGRKLFLRHLNKLLAEHLMRCIHGKDMTVALVILRDELDSAWSTSYFGTDSKSEMLSDLCRHSDLGFLGTLSKVYGSELSATAKSEYLKAAASYQEFKEKYLKTTNIHTLDNCFYYIDQELEKRGDDALKTIMSEWILRGGKPSLETIRKHASDIETGY